MAYRSAEITHPNVNTARATFDRRRDGSTGAEIAVQLGTSLRPHALPCLALLVIQKEDAFYGPHAMLS